MNMRLDDPIAEVRQRADIVEIISETVVLKRSGRNFLGLCPFHGERTPSFNVNPERQIFRCFGCGEGGDVFSFVMKSQSLAFPEALRQLAERYGIALPDRRPDADDLAPMREANALAAEFYQRMLAHDEIGAVARAYLAGRGIDPALAHQFGVGFAPAHWDSLHRYLLSQKVPAAIQEKAALVRPRSGGNGFYDYFRNRVIFPIQSEAGHVVGFGARAIAEGDEPKYLNSPETPLYRKGHLLYGLHQAREAIKARDEAVLMEGYMDVITAHAHGFQHTVGVLGTALTPSQARVLLRFTPSKRVVLAFDADRAGQQAAERGLGTLSEVTQGLKLEARVVAVPAGKDPDAYLRANGAQAFQQLLDEAPDLFAFLLGRAVEAQDIATPAGRAAAVAACVPVLKQIESFVSRAHYVGWLAKKLGVREETIELELNRGARPKGSVARGPVTVRLSVREAEQMLLYYMVDQPFVAEAMTEKLAGIPFEATHQRIREHIERRIAIEGRTTWAAMLDEFAGQEEAKTVSAIMFAAYEERGIEPAHLVASCIDTLLYHYWTSELESVRKQLKEASGRADAEADLALAKRLRQINEFLIHLKHKRGNIIGAPGASTEKN